MKKHTENQARLAPWLIRPCGTSHKKTLHKIVFRVPKITKDR